MPLKGLRLGRNQKDDTSRLSGNSKKTKSDEQDNLSKDATANLSTANPPSVETTSKKPLANPTTQFDVDRDSLVPPRSANGESRPSSSRLSRFKLRHHSSDTSLATTAKGHNDAIPPVPAVPPRM
jgi:hypothetical protein